MSNNYQLICDDASIAIQKLPAHSVHSVITSPPYYKLRDYGYEKQIGQENSVQEYINNLLQVFNAVKQCLVHEGTIWVNLGDVYSHKYQDGYKKGDLMGLPWLFAHAMQKDGWYLKSDVVWAKPNPIPSGAINKPIVSHEYLFLFAKNEDYFFDAEAIKENSTEKNKDGTYKKRYKRDVWTVPTASYKGSHFAVFPTKLIEPCVLSCTSEYGCCSTCKKQYVREIKRHRYATRPGINAKIDETTLANRDAGRHFTETETIGWQKSCVCADATIDKCVILDPFCGSATTGIVAVTHNRKFIGIDANPQYLEMARQRLQDNNIQFE